MPHRLVITLLLAALTACGTTLPEATPELPTPDPVDAEADEASRKQDAAAAEKQTRAFVHAKQAQDWGTLWDMAATVHRDVVVSVGKRPAEADDLTAKAQGFSSAAEVRKLTPRDWFVRRRQHLAGQALKVYKSGATLAAIDVRPAIMVPFPSGRISVHPVHVTLSDGTIDKLAATREGEHWRMLEK